MAPAYRIVKESREIQFVSGQIPELRVRTIYSLENYGTSDLASIDVILPDKASYGRKGLLIKVDGREATPAELSAGHQEGESSRVRVPLNDSWSPRQKRDLVIEYTFSSPEDSGVNIGLNSTSFHVVSYAWFPSLQPPTHVLSPFPASPGRIAYMVQIPANFLLRSSGKQVGRTKNGGDIRYRFELRNSDPAAFIVAGQYVDSCSKKGPCGAAFWTLEPLETDHAAAEEQIASAWTILQKNFGLLGKTNIVPHLVESPRLRHVGDGATSAVPFFGGVLVNSQTISLGVYSGDVLDSVTGALAGNWFGVQIYSSNSAVGLSEGLSEYAVIVIDEARHGDSARNDRVLRFLHEYDAACKEAVEKPLIATTTSDPVEQRRIALAKAPLFYIALEDAYGEAPIRQGLAQFVTLLRGQEVGFQDIRAALENATNKDLAPIFRAWLYRPGIPAEFREKYQSAAASEK